MLQFGADTEADAQVPAIDDRLAEAAARHRVRIGRPGLVERNLN
jgi:hypothetical protein